MKPLKFTTTPPSFMDGVFSNDSPLVSSFYGEVIRTKIRGRTAYIHGEAESLAGFDIPKFFDGDMGQLDLPIEDQQIIMVLPDGEFPIKAHYRGEEYTLDSNCYYLILTSEELIMSNPETTLGDVMSNATLVYSSEK